MKKTAGSISAGRLLSVKIPLLSVFTKAGAGPVSAAQHKPTSTFLLLHV
jgi:hypothetical protein